VAEQEGAAQHVTEADDASEIVYGHAEDLVAILFDNY
jgi:hypothetical protein